MAIVRHTETNELYKYEGENIFKNIRTGVSGYVSDEKAQKFFKINLGMTELVNKNPNIELLINKLNLKIQL